MHTGKTTSSDKEMLVWILVVAGIWAAFTISAFVVPVELETKAKFGDAYGALNTFFTGMAFAILIYTAILQRRELELQRQEMRDTREELKGQKEQLALQNRLTQLSARLSALPQLVEQEVVGIRALGSVFSEFSGNSYSPGELDNLASKRNSEGAELLKQCENLEEEIAKRSLETHWVDNAKHRLQSGRSQAWRLTRGATKLLRLSSYFRDMQSIYSELSNGADEKAVKGLEVEMKLAADNDTSSVASPPRDSSQTKPKD